MHRLNSPELNTHVRLNRWAFLLIVVPTLLLSVNTANADRYFNCGSTEPTINGNPNTLMCDDFEDGDWYQTNADTSGGQTHLPNDGWEGSIYAAIPGDFFTANGGAVGTGKTSRHGFKNTTGTQGGVGQAFHYFAPTETVYPEIYHRFYMKPSSNYVFGHEKFVFYQQNGTNTTQTVLLGTESGNSKLTLLCMQCDEWKYQNQGADLSLVPGRWYYIEVHIKLNTTDGASDGIIEMWMDDCGTNGLGCTGPGTLRARHTGLRIRYASNPIYPGAYPSLGVIHQEHFCSTNPPQPACIGEPFNDQVVVSRARIGPMRASSGDATPPASPSGLMFLP